MRCRAILISPGGPFGLTPQSDLGRWHDFLVSKCGGGWNGADIVVVEGRSRAEVLQAIQSSTNVDYSLIIYRGAGEKVSTDVPWKEFRLQLTGGETVLERELNTGAPRCAFIFDCSTPSGAAAPSGSKYRDDSDVNVQRYDDAFLSAIDTSERGLATIVAKDGNGEGLDHRSATSVLIATAVEWASKQSGVLSWPEAIKLCNQESRNTQRSFEYNGGRRLHHFPFAVGGQT